MWNLWSMKEWVPGSAWSNEGPSHWEFEVAAGGRDWLTSVWKKGTSCSLSWQRAVQLESSSLSLYDPGSLQLQKDAASKTGRFFILNFFFVHFIWTGSLFIHSPPSKHAMWLVLTTALRCIHAYEPSPEERVRTEEESCSSEWNLLLCVSLDYEPLWVDFVSVRRPLNCGIYYPTTFEGGKHRKRRILAEASLSLFFLLLHRVGI